MRSVEFKHTRFTYMHWQHGLVCYLRHSLFVKRPPLKVSSFAHPITELAGRTLKVKFPRTRGLTKCLLHRASGSSPKGHARQSRLLYGLLVGHRTQSDRKLAFLSLTVLRPPALALTLLLFNILSVDLTLVNAEDVEGM